jgi:hypothetical protein
LTELEADLISLDEFAAGEFDSAPDLDGLKMGGNRTLMTKHGSARCSTLTSPSYSPF